MDRKTYKAQVRSLKSQYKQARKAEQTIRKAEREALILANGTQWEKLGNSIDKFRLSICEHFENKASEIRYKVEDRDNWEADQVLADVESTLAHYTKKVSKDKELNKKDHTVLGQLYLAMYTMTEKKLGQHPQRQQDALKTIKDLMPTGGEIQQTQELVEAFGDAVAQFANTKGLEFIPAKG